jgi:Protein of unknown function (DUF3999)
VNRLLALLLFAAITPAPEIRYFRYHRPVENIPAQPKQTCLVIDPALFAHSAPNLADLRLYRDRDEVPFLIQTSAPIVISEQPIAPLNLGIRSGQTVFDAAMPDGSYSDLHLKVAGQDFIATVAVTGSQSQTGDATTVGSYTIFDLTRQRLGRSTVLHLPPSDFRYLHFRISGPIAPESLSGLSVSRSPSVKPRYVTVAESSQVLVKDRSSIVEFDVPQNVPVDRIEIIPAAAPANFFRPVKIVATLATKPTAESVEVPRSTSSYGNILRVHTLQNGRHIDEESLSINPPATMNEATKWTVTIENGDDAPLRPALVRVQMLERDLCFDAAPGAAYSLHYGDAVLASPRYDYASLFTPQPGAVQAALEPEQPNPEYQPRPDSRPFTERHPALLWIALAAVVAALGVIALRSARSTPGPRTN